MLFRNGELLCTLRKPHLSRHDFPTSYAVLHAMQRAPGVSAHRRGGRGRGLGIGRGRRRQAAAAGDGGNGAGRLGRDGHRRARRARPGRLLRRLFRQRHRSNKPLLRVQYIHRRQRQMLHNKVTVLKDALCCAGHRMGVRVSSLLRRPRWLRRAWGLELQQRRQPEQALAAGAVLRQPRRRPRQQERRRRAAARRRTPARRSAR